MRSDYYASDAFPFEGESNNDWDEQAVLAKAYTEQYARLARARQSMLPECVVMQHLHSLELAGAHTPIIWANTEELNGENSKYGRFREPMIVTPNLHKAVFRSSLDLNGQIPLSSAHEPLRRALPLLDGVWRDRLNGNLRLPGGWSADDLANAMNKGQLIPGIQSNDEAWLEVLSDEDYNYYLEHPHKINRRRSQWYRDREWVDDMGDLQRLYIETLLDALGSRVVPSVLAAFTSVAVGLTYLDLRNTTLQSSVFTEAIQPLSGLSILILRGVCELENKALTYLPVYCPRLSSVDISSAELLTPIGVAVLVPMFREATNGTFGLSRVLVDNPELVGPCKRNEIMAYQYLEFHGLIPDVWAERWQDARRNGKPFSTKKMKASSH